MLFLCEHWLTPHEVSALKHRFNDSGKWLHMKSSINPEEVLIGRPHGGIGFIGNRVNGIIYKPINIESDRVTGVELISGGRSTLTVFGVYLPHYDGRNEQLQVYSETLAILQCAIAEVNGPFIIVGDMNAALPMQEQLVRQWHRLRPFNPHSYVLHDFLCENDMIVANFMFPQRLSYTYFNAISSSYIDHIFIPAYFINNVKECSILCDLDYNTSDHFPMSLKIELRVNCDKPCSASLERVPSYPKVNWSNCGSQRLYSNEIRQRARLVILPDISLTSTREEATFLANKMCDDLEGVIHDASANVASLHKDGPGQSKHWWNHNCTWTRDRQRFWFHIWKSCDRPRTGHIYTSYKMAKKAYRDACRQAVSGVLQDLTKNLNFLYKGGRLKKFWNQVRRTRNNGSSCDDISLLTLEKYFRDKFECYDDNASDMRNTARVAVEEKYSEIMNTITRDKVISPSMVIRYIKALNSGCSPGMDGIMSEHLKYAIDSDVPVILSHILTMCIQFHIVPLSFVYGVLVPLLKKPTLDPSVPKNYRPVTISSTLSKLLELYVLELTEGHELSDLQFGFLPGRSTCMAAALTQDVISYCNSRGSTVYACSLDAQGAFDAVPHEILFYKALGVVPDHCWAMMMTWYKSICVRVKWGDRLSESISIKRGTRQGGLSSPFLFNLFYRDLIDRLTGCIGGIRIGTKSYNVFCYADDILICSLSVTGLQRLINEANQYVTDHGLLFNPNKTECITFGKQYFDSTPSWKLNETNLNMSDSITYLGVQLSYSKRRCHIDERINACRRAFYSLQGAGLCNVITDVGTASYVWNSAIRPVLIYGLNTVDISGTALRDLESVQGRLVKSMVGIHKWCRTTPVIRAMKICTVESSVAISNLELLRSIFNTNSCARSFYLFLISKLNSGQHHVMDGGLLSRCKNLCIKFNVNFLKYMFDMSYSNKVKCDMKHYDQDGLSDSVHTLLLSRDPLDAYLLNMLLRPF